MIMVGQQAVAGVIGQFCGFGFDMRAFRPHWVQRRDIEMFQNIGHQDSGRALSVRWMLDQIDALVGAADRVGPIAGGGREIGHDVSAASGFQRCHHVFGHLADIEPVAALVGDPAQYFGLTGQGKLMAGFQRLALRQIDVPCAALQGLLGPSR